MMLSLQARAPKHSISVRSLCRLDDYASPDRAFQDYLTIAQRLSDELAYLPTVKRKNCIVELAVLTDELLKRDEIDETTTLTLRPEILSALSELGW